ncbi:hypothetical protein HNY73_019300 [Argiope bruennichi]|uniref:Uncharacterized protein n=1 Tax=Argiope bruennichi TaxID=94029 RepID=A0A8T0EGU7_ARGBR|nr:hypothetical protein HNY73_019300 [Argiope bruennichi]
MTYRRFLKTPEQVMMLQLENVLLEVLNLLTTFSGGYPRFHCFLLAHEGRSGCRLGDADAGHFTSAKETRRKMKNGEQIRMQFYLLNKEATPASDDELIKDNLCYTNNKKVKNYNFFERFLRTAKINSDHKDKQNAIEVALKSWGNFKYRYDACLENDEQNIDLLESS